MRILAIIDRSSIRLPLHLLLGALSAAALLAFTRPAVAQPKTESDQEPSAVSAALAMEQLLVKSIEQAEKSVVAIGIFAGLRHTDAHPPSDLKPDSYGTGVAVGERLILTNHHVVLNELPDERQIRATAIFVHAAGHAQWLRVRIKAADPRTDLAVLEIVPSETEAPQLVPIKMAPASRELKKGQIVLSLGNPYGIASDGEVSASWGIISNIDRRVAKKDATEMTKLQDYGGLIQTDAKLNLGTSGGALINLRGEMVGLTTSLAATAGYETPAGFAIAVDKTFQRAVKSLISGREVEHGLIGVIPKELETERGAQPHGVVVDGTISGVPAGQVLRRDDLITHIDGRRIRLPAELIVAIGEKGAGDTVTVNFQRPLGQQQVQQASVQLNKFDVQGTKVITTKRPFWRGLHVDYPEPVLVSRSYRYLLGDCLLVTEVDADSPAAAAGIEKGSYIRGVNGTRFVDPAEATKSVANPDRFLQQVASLAGPVELEVRSPHVEDSFRRVVVPSASEPSNGGSAEEADDKGLVE